MTLRHSIAPIIICMGLLVAQLEAQQNSGYAAKRPVFGGSCPTCPWGAMGDIVKAALKSSGGDVQMCYNCAGGPRAAPGTEDGLNGATRGTVQDGYWMRMFASACNGRRERVELSPATA